MTVPYTFGTATTSIPLSNLDANFNTPITLGNTSIYLGNTTTTIGNLTLTNATISSGNVTLTNVSVTTANVTNITVSGTANIATGNVTTLTSTSITDSGLTSGRVTYAGASGLLTDSSALTYNGTALTASASSAISGVFNRNTSSGATVQIQVVGGSVGTLGSDTGGNGIFDIAAASSMYLRATGASSIMAFSANNAEKMRITDTSLYTASGVNVGIGTSSPSQLLHLNVTSGAVYELISSGSNNLYLGYENTRAVSVIQSNNALVFDVGSGYTERVRIDTSGNFIVNNGASQYVQLAPTGSITSVHANGSGGDSLFSAINGVSNGYQISVTTGNAQSYKWHNGGTQSMTLDASGNLLVGTTSASNGAARLDVVAPTGNNLAATLKNDAGAGQWNTQIWNAGTSGDNGFVQFATETSYTGRGSITYNRAGGLVAYNVTSDYRAKDIISTTVNSGEVIDSVPVYMGKMKDATQERPMFIAHETPSYAHTGEKDAVDVDGNPVYQQMDASTLIPVMWAEIQSLRQRIKTLENK